MERGFPYPLMVREIWIQRRNEERDMDIRGLVIYRNLKHQTLFEQMAGLMGMSEEKESRKEKCI